MAAQFKVVVTGIPSIDRRLKTLPTRVQKKVANRAMRAAMKIVAKVIKALAPYITGTLRSNVVVRAGLKRRRSEVSIDARIDANAETKRTSAKTGKTVFYPAIVEYGRKKQGIEGDHYMLDAFKRAGETARRVAIRMLREGVEAEANKG